MACNVLKQPAIVIHDTEVRKLVYNDRIGTSKTKREREGGGGGRRKKGDRIIIVFKERSIGTLIENTKRIFE